MDVSSFYNMTTMIFLHFDCPFFNTSNEGWKGLMEEMEMEVKRISKRNLGRDDRLGLFQIHCGSYGHISFFFKISLPIKLLTAWILVALLTDWPRDRQTERWTDRQRDRLTNCVISRRWITTEVGSPCEKYPNLTLVRCISDHGREARFPFLDEEVVSFLNSLPVWLKVRKLCRFTDSLELYNNTE